MQLSEARPPCLVSIVLVSPAFFDQPFSFFFFFFGIAFGLFGGRGRNEIRHTSINSHTQRLVAVSLVYLQTRDTLPLAIVVGRVLPRRKINIRLPRRRITLFGGLVYRTDVFIGAAAGPIVRDLRAFSRQGRNVRAVCRCRGHGRRGSHVVDVPRAKAGGCRRGRGGGGGTGGG